MIHSQAFRADGGNWTLLRSDADNYNILVKLEGVLVATATIAHNGVMKWSR
jgi:hypothetical protein